jgi:hypothetical protein
MSVRLGAEELRSIASGTIGASYMGVGTVFSHPIRLVHLTNNTDTSLLISLDGITDHFFIPSSGFLLLDITANKTRESGWYIAEGQRFYVKQESGAPSSGSFYVTALYGSVLGA